MDRYDLGAGLIGGLQQGLNTYMQTSERKKEREESALERQKQREIMMAQGGLIEDPINGLIKDPAIEERKKQEKIADVKAKAALEGRNAQFDDNGNLISANRSPDEVSFLSRKAKSEKNGGLSLTPGEKKADEAFGKQYQEYIGAGGKAAVDQNLNQLESAVQDLQGKDKVSGGWTTKVPILNSDIVQDTINPKGAQIKNKIYSAVQGTVKQLLPGAISDYESKSILERAYNPRLSDEANIENATREINKLKAKAAQMEASTSHFAEKGTLQGFKQPQGLINSAPTAQPKSVIQNGHTYILNEATGAYE